MKKKSYEMVEKKSWIVLALCRFSVGIRIYFLLFSIIYNKSISWHTHTNQIQKEFG